MILTNWIDCRLQKWDICWSYHHNKNCMALYIQKMYIIEIMKNNIPSLYELDGKLTSDASLLVYVM